MEFDTRYTAADIAQRIKDVGQKITADYPEDGALVLIGILKGAGFFLADLARAIARPSKAEYIDVLRGDLDEEIVDFHFVTKFQVRDKDLIILKDVVRSGVIESYLLNQLREQGPRSIRFAALVDRPHERKSSLLVDYVLLPSEDGVLVGYGMEYKGEAGNLPFIAQVRIPGEEPFDPPTGRYRVKS